MAEEHHDKKTLEERCEEPVMVENVDVQERGMFDFLGGKKEPEKHQEDVKGGEYGEEQVKLATQFEEKVTVKSENPEVESREEHEDKKHHVGLLEKLRRSDSSSSSSSEEEECEEAEKEERNKKKKEKKEQKKKLEEDKKKREEEDVTVPVEKCDVEEPVPVPEEKKGFLEKMKEKLPGQHKKAEEVPPPPPQAVEGYATSEVPPPPCQEGGDQAKEKKGIFEKIKEKLPGFHHKDEEEKEKEKEKC